MLTISLSFVRHSPHSPSLSDLQTFSSSSTSELRYESQGRRGVKM